MTATASRIGTPIQKPSRCGNSRGHDPRSRALSANDPTIPYGFCQCGCGEKTPLASITKASRGNVKGQPVRFLNGHFARPSAEERFWAKVNKTETCWLWTAATNRYGYGLFRPDGRLIAAHRFAWSLAGREIPDGMELDHTCSTRNCVNPSHLEAVTHRENVRRSAVTKLTGDDARDIRKRYSDGEPPADIASRFGISPNHVWMIGIGRIWGDVA